MFKDISTENPEHFKLLEQAYSNAPINKIFRAQLHISQGRSEIILPIQPNLLQAGGAVHGAVYFKVLDDAAYFAVNSVVEDVFVLTVSFNIYFTRPITKGAMHTVGQLVHQSKRLFIAESQVFNDEGEQIARGSGIYMRSNKHIEPKSLPIPPSH